jgi:hypothetical protein
VIVLGILALASLIIHYLKSSKREWSLILSGAGLGVSLILIFERSGLV